MDKRLMHYQFPRDQIQIDGTTATLHTKVAAIVEDATDAAIVEAILEAARAEEVTDLYLLDKTFILDAIREKLERENPKPLTIEELKQMNGEPVWVEEFSGRIDATGWALVEVDDRGTYKCVPFVTDRYCTWNVITRGLHCYRHKPKEEV